jgi:anti-sigma factor RsiW
MTHDTKAPGSAHPPVDCQQVETLLSDYVDARLDEPQRDALDDHLSQCAPCLAFLKQYRFAPQALRTRLLAQAPVDLEKRLLSFLLSRTANK